MEALLSERLLAVLRQEMAALEADLDESEGPPGGMKSRIEAVGQMTRTLEKLLELKRLEALEARGGEDGDGETARLRAEMLRRLQALDARRRGGPALFDGEGRFAGEDCGQPAAAAAREPA